jgi:hypothetical protein
VIEYTDGQAMGCSDTGAPEEFSEEQLSRGLDLLNAAARVSPAIHSVVYKSLPSGMTFEMTWCKWRYRSPR